MPEKANSDTGFNWVFDSQRAVRLDDAAAKEVLRMREKYNKAAELQAEKEKDLGMVANNKKKRAIEQKTKSESKKMSKMTMDAYEATKKLNNA